MSKKDEARMKQPLTRFLRDGENETTKGYVAKYDATYRYLLFGGSSRNVISLLDMKQATVIAEEKDLKSGVYSGAIYKDPENKWYIKIVYTTGKSVNVLSIKNNNR